LCKLKVTQFVDPVWRPAAAQCKTNL